MKIPVTGNNINELLQVVKAFPNGVIIVENSIAYWETTDKVQAINIQQCNRNTNNLPTNRNKGDTIKRMQEALFSAF